MVSSDGLSLPGQWLDDFDSSFSTNPQLDLLSPSPMNWSKSYEQFESDIVVASFLSTMICELL